MGQRPNRNVLSAGHGDKFYSLAARLDLRQGQRARQGDDFGHAALPFCREPFETCQTLCIARTAFVGGARHQTENSEGG